VTIIYRIIDKQIIAIFEDEPAIFYDEKKYSCIVFTDEAEMEEYIDLHGLILPESSE